MVDSKTEPLTEGKSGEESECCDLYYRTECSLCCYFQLIATIAGCYTKCHCSNSVCLLPAVKRQRETKHQGQVYSMCLFVVDVFNIFLNFNHRSLESAMSKLIIWSNLFGVVIIPLVNWFCYRKMWGNTKALSRTMQNLGRYWSDMDRKTYSEAEILAGDRNKSCSCQLTACDDLLTF